MKLANIIERVLRYFDEVVSIFGGEAFEEGSIPPFASIIYISIKIFWHIWPPFTVKQYNTNQTIQISKNKFLI